MECNSSSLFVYFLPEHNKLPIIERYMCDFSWWSKKMKIQVLERFFVGSMGQRYIYLYI